MRIGIFFTPYKSQGGAYQYCVSVLESLLEIPNNKYFIFSLSPDIPKHLYRNRNVKIIKLYSASPSSLYLIRGAVSNLLGRLPFNAFSLIYKIGLFPFIGELYKYTQRQLINLLNKHKLDLIFYPSLMYLSFLVDVPFVVTVYDLGHRNRNKFKEAIKGGRWEYREYGVKNVSQKAFRIFVDSDVLKRHLVRDYKAKKNSVVILPYLPPSYLRVRISKREEGRIHKRLKLPSSYIFYPAKFWPHKNHLNLVKAIKLLQRKKIDVRLILTGSKEAEYTTFKNIMEYINENGLKEKVKYLGYVGNKELYVIYKRAKALVMPTLLGPTNIPVYEAWAMGTPVLYSDIAGCREQLGNAGLLINPKDPKDIADKIIKVYTNPKLREELAMKGRKRLRLWDKKDFDRTIAGVIKDFNEENVKGNN